MASSALGSASPTASSPGGVKVRGRAIRSIAVVGSRQITPLMRRITFGGAGVAELPDGPNIKLIFPPEGFASTQEGLERAVAAGQRPVVRTYSVRRHDREKAELDVDFLLHEPKGVASNWAVTASVGDVVGVGGPGSRKIRPASFYLFAGDHCALPAIAKALEGLPDEAVGCAFIEIPDEAERQSLAHPAGVSVHWLVGGDDPVLRPSRLVDAVTSLPWSFGQDVFVWVGAESASVRAIRSYLRVERQLDRTMVLAVGYWKRGVSEDTYHDTDDNDRDADYHAVWREERHALAKPAMHSERSEHIG